MIPIRTAALAGLVGLALAACGGRASNPPATGANPYLWAATLDVLGFLPVETADPATGTFATAFGTAPGGAQRYRATARIAAPLDARSLDLVLSTPGGPAPAATRAEVVEAILTRARQLRIADLGL